MSDMEYAATVAVGTASAVIASKDDPYRILVADSKKHPRPVVPGGKIEHQDMADGSLEDGGLRCVLREVVEEIGATLENPRYIGTATDTARDVRVVPRSKLREAVTSPVLAENIPDTAPIKASYGCLDYIYTGSVDEKLIRTTEELSGLRFIDIRHLKPHELSAGHDVIVLWYRRMLDEGWARIPTDAMKDFEADRRVLLSPHCPAQPKTKRTDFTV